MPPPTVYGFRRNLRDLVREFDVTVIRPPGGNFDRLWCLVDSMEGPWQMGHPAAETCGRRARKADQLMHFPDLNRSSTLLTAATFVVCGSSGHGTPVHGQ